MPGKKSFNFDKLLRAITPKRAPEWTNAKWWTVRPMIAGTGIGVLVVAMVVVVAAYQSGPPSVQKKADAPGARTAAGANGSLGTPSGGVADSARTSAQGANAKSARVTITGCLERSDETYKLTDTAGASSPTSRSWKSGFLKKRPAHVEVIDSVKRLNLASHVGERVSVTGTLVDREMHAGSVQRVASSCSASKAKI